MKLETTTMNEQTQQNSQPLTESTEQTTSASSVSSAVETDLPRLQAENDTLRHELRLRNARDQLTRTLASENARSPELLFEAATARLAFDDDGNLTNLSDIVTDIRSRFPEQFIAESSGLDVATEPGGKVPALPPPIPPPINAGAGRIGSRPPLTKAMLAEMKPRDTANLNWSDVQQVMES